MRNNVIYCVTIARSISLTCVKCKFGGNFCPLIGGMKKDSASLRILSGHGKISYSCPNVGVNHEKSFIGCLQSYEHCMTL